MNRPPPLRSGKFLLLLAGIMELSWIYGWADFLIPVLLQRPFNAAGGFAAMAFAYVLTRLSFGRGWRVIWIVLLQCAGFTCGSFIMLHHAFYGSHALLDGIWVRHLFGAAKDPFTIFSISMYLLWGAIFWWAGMGLARRPSSYTALCRRFDLGLAAFFALFLFKLLLAVRGGTAPATFVDVSLAVTFLLCGLCAVGLARSEGGAKKEYLAGRRRIGIFVAFASAVIVLAGCLALLFLSQGQLFAEAGWKAFSGAGNLLGPAFVSVMRFLFTNRIREGSAPGQKSGPGLDVSAASGRIGWMETVELALAWFIVVVCVLAIFFLMVYLVIFLFKRLSARSGVNYRGPGNSDMPGLLDFLKRCFRVFRDCIGKISGGRRVETARSLYGALLRWGRHSGMAHSACETPSEFGTRLKALIPALAVEIDTVVNGLNREAYGGMVLDKGELGVLRASLRRMASPRWWPLRTRSFFTCAGFDQGKIPLRQVSPIR